jgi:hypothetical protein
MMGMRKILVVACLVLSLGLMASFASAAVVSSIPGGTVFSMPAVDYFGSGPQTFGSGQITWTSSFFDSTFGFTGIYNFGGVNGAWDGTLGPMAGVNTSFDDEGAVDTMTFTFANPVSAVGGFLNYVPGGSTNTTIAVYNGSTLINSYNLTFTTGGGINSGLFVGFDEGSNIITSFTLTDNYIGITGLTVQGLSAAPLPSTMLLLSSGLLSLAVLRRRMKY